MFELTKDELENLRSQIGATSRTGKFAFCELLIWGYNHWSAWMVALVSPDGGTGQPGWWAAAIRGDPGHGQRLAPGGTDGFFHLLIRDRILRAMR